MQVTVYSITDKGEKTYVTLKFKDVPSYATLVFELNDWAKYGESILAEFKRSGKQITDRP